MGRKKYIRFYVLIIWMGIVPLISSASISVFIITHEGLLADFTMLQWALFFLLSIFTMALAITPTTFMALIAGFFLGFNGIIPMIVSYQLASLVGYFLAARLDEGFIELIRNKYPKSAGIMDRVHHNQFGLTFLSRLSPAFPFAVMNVVLSASRIKLKHFFWGGMLGMLPRTLFFVWVGKEASRLSEVTRGNENILISFVLSLLVVLVMVKILISGSGKKLPVGGTKLQ